MRLIPLRRAGPGGPAQTRTPHHLSRFFQKVRRPFFQMGALPPNPWDLSLSGQQGQPGATVKTAPDLSALGSALRSHPCVALSSAQAISSLSNPGIPTFNSLWLPALFPAAPDHTTSRPSASPSAPPASDPLLPVSPARDCGRLGATLHNASSLRHPFARSCAPSDTTRSAAAYCSHNAYSPPFSCRFAALLALCPHSSVACGNLFLGAALTLRRARWRVQLVLLLARKEGFLRHCARACLLFQ